MVDETLNKFDVVKEGSYLLYDFKDITEENVKVPSVLEGDANGEKEVEELATSPLFHLDTINSEADAKFLEAITSKVPYYHSQVTKVEDDAEAVLNMSDARDPSINDVHSALQEDAFWKEWFTSVWGKEQNKLLLEAYNRLQFPYLNENQYLNAAKFAEIAKESSEGEASQVEFDEDNHLNDIVEERLQAIYNLMNYAQLNPQFLDDWAESLWRSGVCTKEEAEKSNYYFIVYAKSEFNLKENNFSVDIIYNDPALKFDKIDLIDPFEIKEKYMGNRKGIIFSYYIWQLGRKI